MVDTRAHIRIARPAVDLADLERFYVAGLGLDVLYRKHAADGGSHDLLMVGWAGAGWHLELTVDHGHDVAPAPTADDLLVIYLGKPVDDELVAKMTAAGGKRVPALNAYWDEWGVTFEDPDGYRLVLCTREWTNTPLT